MKLFNAVTVRAARTVLLTKKHSPGLLFGVGVASMVGSTVLACNATLKLEAVLDHSDKMKSEIGRGVTTLPDKYSKKDASDDLRTLKIQTIVKIGKLYAPAAAVGILGVACLTGSHVVLTNRNAALMAAYATLDKGFKEYQQRVKDTIGEEKERQIRMDGDVVKIKDPESGKDMMLTRARLAGEYSIYARLWDETTSTSVQKQPEYNLAFLTAKQNYLNDRLNARGHVLLNDAYDELGLERTKEGCIVGWVKGNGDNYIDFGIFNRDDPERFVEYITGLEGGVWLDFNVDGVVYDKI